MLQIGDVFNDLPEEGVLLVGVPKGAKFRVRMREEEVATIFIKLGGEVSQHYLEWADNQHSTLRPGPPIGRNIRG